MPSLQYPTKRGLLRSNLDSGLFLVLTLSLWNLSASDSRSGLTATVLDQETGKLVPARVQLIRGNQKLLPAGFTFYDKSGEKHFFVPSSFRLPLDPGQYVIRIERGKEYLPLEETLIVTAGQETKRDFPLKRWINMQSRGWYSGDLHVHRPPTVMAETLLAEDLNVAPVVTAHYWSEWGAIRETAKADKPIVQVDDQHAFSVGGYEIERIIQGPGAVLLFGPILLPNFQGYELYPPSNNLTRLAHEQGGYVDGDKVFWLDVPVNVALGEIDSIQIACNHFFPRGIDADLKPWTSWKPDAGFERDKGFALWIMDLYYKFLNCGFHLPVSGGSACGVKPLSVGYSRVYVKLDTPFSYENFFRSLKAGHSFSTNGPMLDLKVDGHEIGSQISFKGRRLIQIEAMAEAANELESLEIVVNGKIVAIVPGGGRRKLSLKKPIEVNESVWVAARAFEKSRQTVVFGQTGPTYVLRDGRSVQVPAAAKYWLDKVDQLIERALRSEGFKEESHRQETLAAYEQARKVYRDLLRE